MNNIEPTQRLSLIHIQMCIRDRVVSTVYGNSHSTTEVVDQTHYRLTYAHLMHAFHINFWPRVRCYRRFGWRVSKAEQRWFVQPLFNGRPSRNFLTSSLLRGNKPSKKKNFAAINAACLVYFHNNYRRLKQFTFNIISGFSQMLLRNEKYIFSFCQVCTGVTVIP